MEAERYALAYAARGWPVMPAEGKQPLTRHGVKDASTDAELIRRWFQHWPHANLALACGSPGPQVLDVDNLERARDVIAALEGVPCVATTRGRHFYFAGAARSTIALGYGELRGRGSYVICPPSMHESGREYVWLLAPNGPLPPAPALLADRPGTGAGRHRTPRRKIVAGDGRWPYLRDFAVRLLRAGVTDERRILAHLRLEFEISCDPMPAARSGALESLATWAAASAIADRERGLDELTERIRAWQGEPIA